MSLILLFLGLPVLTVFFYVKLIRTFAFDFSAKYIYWVYPFSLSVNTFILSLLICDFYLSVHSIEHSFFKYIWRVVYWINFTLGFLVFPLIFERERNSNASSNLCLLIRFYLRRLIIISLIAVPIVALMFLILKLQASKLLTLQSLYLIPIVVVTLWGCILILLHLSMVFVNVPKAILRMLFPSKKLGRWRS